jgi:hypothetical protein
MPSRGVTRGATTSNVDSPFASVLGSWSVVVSHVRVRLQWKGARLEYQGTLSFFERVVEPLVAAAAAGGPGAPATPAGAAQEVGADEGIEEEGDEKEQEGKDEGYRPDSADFGHFIRQLGPEAADPDRQIVAFAFFLWNYEKKEEFDEEEIAGCFRSLGLPPPGDVEALYRDLAERRRFLDAADEPGRWRLTQKGRNYVKSRLLAAS